MRSISFGQPLSYAMRHKGYIYIYVWELTFFHYYSVYLFSVFLLFGKTRHSRFGRERLPIDLAGPGEREGGGREREREATGWLETSHAKDVMLRKTG